MILISVLSHAVNKVLPSLLQKIILFVLEDSS